MVDELVEVQLEVAHSLTFSFDLSLVQVPLNFQLSLLRLVHFVVVLESEREL